MNQLPAASEPFATQTEGIGSRERWLRIRAEMVAAGIVGLGFLLRVREAWGTFLNPDEALHFFIANRSSLSAVYKASLTQAHPPLLFFLLYGLRAFGNSEFILRLPTIVAGTLFCWVFFKWLTRILGLTAGLAGLVLAALLPPMVSVTAQVRQYGLLLVFAVCALWFLERALEENSAKLMLISAAALWLAMLAHYSALLFAVSIGVYAIARFCERRASAHTVIAWITGEVVALALAVLLYVTHISKIRGTTMAEQAFDGWLRKSYFHHGQDNFVSFLVTRSFSFFQFTVGQLVVGDLIALVWVAGIILLLRGKFQISLKRYEVIAIFVLPFALNYGAALLDRYPYGGTRHCIYLAIFALAAVSAGVAYIAGQDSLRALAISGLIVTLCFVFRTNHAPYISRADQSRTNMYSAVSFVRDQIPVDAPIFVDYESGIELGHYLCQQQPISYEGSIPDFLVFNCGGHRVISTIPDVWAFTPSVFVKEWETLVRAGSLNPGTTVWVGQLGWMVKLDDDLRKVREFQNLQTQTFGNNLRFFKMTVGQSMPNAGSLP